MICAVHLIGLGGSHGFSIKHHFPECLTCLFKFSLAQSLECKFCFWESLCYQKHSKEKGAGGCWRYVGCEFVFTIIEILCILKQLTNFIDLDQVHFFQITVWQFFFKVYSENCHKWFFWMEETGFSLLPCKLLIFGNFNIVKKIPDNDHSIHITFRVLWLYLCTYWGIFVLCLYLWLHGLIKIILLFSLGKVSLAGYHPFPY